MHPEHAFKAARPRFVVDAIEIDGVLHTRKIDPVTGIFVTMPQDQPGTYLLASLFKSEWIAHHGTTNGCG